MHIAILGAGRVGSTLGRRLAAAGHTIHYARRDPSTEVPERLAHERAATGSAASVVERSEVVLLATPWAAAEEVLTPLEFGGRVLLDATNPIGPGMMLTHGHSDSGGEQVQRWAPSARVAKVFNSTGRENMEAPTLGDASCMMLACSDDDDARSVAVQLAADIGFDARPFGELKHARLLEPLALVWIRLAMMGGRDFGFVIANR